MSELGQGSVGWVGVALPCPPESNSVVENSAFHLHCQSVGLHEPRRQPVDLWHFIMEEVPHGTKLAFIKLSVHIGAFTFIHSLTGGQPLSQPLPCDRNSPEKFKVKSCIRQELLRVSLHGKLHQVHGDTLKFFQCLSKSIRIRFEYFAGRGGPDHGLNLLQIKPQSPAVLHDDFTPKQVHALNTGGALMNGMY